MELFKKILKFLGDILVGIIIIVGLTFLVSLLPLKNNYKVLMVMSGSMEPAIKTGSLIFTQPSNSYKVGDIITFRPENTASNKKTTTHRIANIEDGSGDRLLTTKGDANKSSDGAKIKEDQIVGKYLFKIPYLGYLLAFIKTLPGLVIVIIIPATIIIYEEFKKITHETKTIVKLRAEKRRSKNEVSS